MKRDQRSDEKSRPDRADLPREITMTDLEAAEEQAGRRGAGEEAPDIHAAGTPLGGTASGGLAGTNAGRGDPDDADLESAFGSGIHDNGEDDDED